MPKNKNLKFCPHCGFDVHKSTYFRHKALHCIDGKWKTDTGEEISVNKEVKPKKDMCEKSDKVYCSHCDKMVPERTYYYHKSFMEDQPEHDIGISNDPRSDNTENSTDVNDIPNDVRADTTDKANDTNEGNPQVHQFVWSEHASGRRKQRIFLDSFVGNEEENNDLTGDSITDQLQDMWEDLSLSDIKNDVCSDPSNLEETNRQSKQAMDILHWLVVFISVWTCFFNISDNAVYHLLHFLKAIFAICGNSIPMLAIVAALFPTTVYSLHKLQGTGQDSFKKYVVCPDCFCTYIYDDCVEIKNGKKQSKKCQFVKHPNHPHRNKRKACGATLLKEVTLKGNVTALYPRKVYCYNSIINSLQSLIDRPGFNDKCEKWKNRVTVPGTYRDIYDGKVWKKFQVYQKDQEDPRPFLDLPRHLGLLINLDWFQPFKNSPYSVGVIYLVILNLPREERFKQENVILVGVIPGPKEPTGEQMSFFIKPLVDELEQLWFQGMEYKSKKYFAVLLGCACDLPAGRKLCGLLSFSSRIGCSKCTKEFHTKNFGEKANYGGFDRPCAKRNYAYIKCQAEKAQKAKTQTEQQSIEKAAGCRWSELMRLPYYDAVEMCIIDPMHALYLGAAKFLLKDIWPEQCNITPDVMCQIQQVVDNTQLPSDVGRIPFKIASNFNSFTSDQFKNWTLYFSLYTMKPHLSKPAYNVWLNFVEACWLFSRPVITVQQVSKAHEKLMAFLRGFESWLDSSYTTPNFHMISHLAEQILDYGSFYGYWCYSFERYNGIQGSFHTNQRSVELQLMRKFLRSTSLANMTPPDIYKEQLGSLMDFRQKDNGSLLLEIIESIPIPNLKLLLALAEGTVKPLNMGFEYFCNEKLYKTIGMASFAYVESNNHKQYLHTAVETFLGPVDFGISGAFMKYPAIEYLGEKYGSTEGSMKRNCHIMVNSWLGIDGNIDCNSGEDRPAEIIYFIKVNIPVDGLYRPIVLAYVRWFQKHSAETMYKTNLAKVYAKSLYESEGPAVFIPIQKIKSKFISGFSKVKGELVRIVLPKPPKIYW